MIRVLTVRQPWAWAIVHGGKDVENRTRNLAGDYRGPVAIHAGRTWATLDRRALTTDTLLSAWDAYQDEVAPPELVGPMREGSLSLEAGAIIGVVDLIDVHNTAQEYRAASGMPAGFYEWSPCSPWGESNRMHLVLENPRPLSVPISFKGALHLQTAPEGVEAEIVRQIGPLQ